MTEERVLLGGVHNIINMILENAGLQAVVNAISDLYDAPVSVIDNAYSILAYSAHRLPDFPQMVEEFKNGHLRIDIQKLMKKVGYTLPQKKKTAPTSFRIVDSSVPLYNNLTIIYVNSFPAASFSIFTEDKPLSGILETYLPTIAGALSLEMQKSYFYLLNKANYYTHLFSLIIEGDPVKLSDIRERLRVFGYELGALKRVVCVDTSRDYYSGSEIQLLADRLRASLKNSIYVIQEAQIIYLQSFDGDDTFPDIRSEVGEEISPTGIRVGVSSIYSDIEKTKLFLKQARHAIDTGGRISANGYVTYFDDIYFEDWVSRAETASDIHLYCFAPLLRLIEMDRQQGSQLAETLYVYLENPKDPIAVCQKLHIHRNTLYYRLQKIRSVLGCDFENGHVISHIYNTFSILRHQNLLGNLKI